MRRRAALVLLASALPGAGLAAEKVLYSFSVPSWQWTMDHPDKSVTIREMPDGYTSIRFHRPVIRGGINTQLEQEVWEDSTSYVVSDARGKNLYCYCAADAGPSASMRAFLSREVYYFVDDTLGADPAKRQGEFDYPYQVVEVRRDRVARYACTFHARLPQAVSRDVLRQKIGSEGSVVPDQIADFLATHGADLTADRCAATSGSTT